jgi:DnaJ-class molecular chaperone
MNWILAISNFWERYRKTIRNVLYVLAALFLVIVLIEVFFHASATYFPGACTACHYEDFAYDAWKKSTHNNLNCAGCHHYRFGMYTGFILKYWAGFYSGHPIVDVKDEACFRCHAEHVMADTVYFRNNVHFNHSEHYRKVNRTVELRCSSCHTALEGKKHMEVSEENCFLCHFKGVKRGQSYTGCPSCHGTPKDIVQHGGYVFSHQSYLRLGVTCDQCHVDVTKGTGNVPERICRDCHVERLKFYGDAFRIHEIHVTRLDLKCFRCHTAIEHGEIRLVETLEVTCERCHGTSHSMQKEMYMGTGGRGVPDVPSRMFAAQVACDGCHPKMGEAGKLSPAEDLRLKRESCVRCHGEGFDRMLDDWLREMQQLVREVRPFVQRGTRLAQSVPENRVNAGKIKDLVEEAQYNLKFVVEGRGVHNIDYAVRLLKRSVEDVQQAFRLAGRAAPSVKDAVLTTSDGYCTAFCHHIVKPKKQLTFERIDFPHRMHSAELGLECTTCHSPDKHGLRVITKTECMNCHHEQQDIACTTCHVEQNELYTGNIRELGISDQPDVMAEAEVECSGCHDVSQSGEVLGLVAEACTSCHEEGYDEMLREWYNNLQDLMSRVIVWKQETQDKLRRGDIPKNQILEVRRKLSRAEKVLAFLEKARPVHNQALAEELLMEFVEDE